MIGRSTNEETAALALRALAATLADQHRAERFLTLTGLDAETLRARAGEPSLLVALIEFLERHEPDLIDVANTIESSPAGLVEARRALSA